MKILLSAYACEPGLGSEPGVGWNWAIELAELGNEVEVLTRPMHKRSIEKELLLYNNEIRDRLKFVYYDLPFWKRKRGGKGTQLHYIIWQFFILNIAIKLNRNKSFDIVHHISFGVFRHPSLLHFLNIPFVFGPVGGGERTPFKLRKSFTMKNKIKEAIRDLINYLSRFDPLLLLMYKRSYLILCKTEETLSFIPKRYRDKATVKLEIGINNEKISNEIISNTNQEKKPFKILYVGRLTYWKGLHLALNAYSKFCEIHSNSQFEIIGKGPDKDYFNKLADELNIKSNIVWIDWIEQKELKEHYKSSDVFLFPSLHDSSGNVVLESLSSGLPVICLDLGGPGTIVDNSCGYIIKTIDKSEEMVIQDLKKALIELYNNRNSLERLSMGALNKSIEYTWERVVNNIYKDILNNK